MAVTVGLAYDLLSVYVPVARISGAPLRAGMLLFTSFTGLIGLPVAAGIGLGWPG